MDTRLLAHYNRELQHLRDMAGEFAAEYPKIAGRLSLDGFDCADPYVERLLEGFAFMAARVQLKFDAGYTRFTQHLLDTVYPGALAPLPSMLIVKFEPDLRNPGLADGFGIARGSVLHSRLPPDEQTACEFRTGHDTTLWPVAIRHAAYLSHIGDLAAMGIEQARGAKAGIRLAFDVTAGLRVDQLALDRLPLFLCGMGQIPAHLYEQILGNSLGFVVRPAAANDTCGHARWQEFCEPSRIRAVGFSDGEALLPQSPRGFSGHRLLQEYFAFPTRFKFVEFGGLSTALRRCDAAAFEIIVLLDRSDPALDQAVDASAFAVHCVPAINLFAKRADRIVLNDRHTEHHLVADRTRPMDFEIHTVSNVVGHGAGERQSFHPFYAAGHRLHPSGGAYYSVHRQPRHVSTRQRRNGARSSYLGSELFVSLVDAREAAFAGEVRELAVEALCTNRDLPLLMPLGGSDDFRLESAAPLVGIRCIKGPTRPRPSHGDGEAHWRLINQLSLNYLSLLDGDERQGAAALRDLLQLHADPEDPAAARHIEGLRNISHRPIYRRVPSPGPICMGRGLEITLICDDGAFEGSGAFLLGSVLEQFFARHVSINSFTEMVLRTTARGEVMRWPTRLGRRHIC